ncbi:hypothetical protein GCM10007421_19680 [Halopseudomonas oceani]|uniref:Uncharacterized protein n=1 Tax=Halopseudomonas oceani TaxID=1708783 RepID=A0A2P4EVH3_9GAMM|nr:capsule biosynthesis GfcC family protein [Halopseudomonas oceani]POB03568.1 hypothetical protein C1949_09345 [Halopseudomonas oceani]GGE45580.1 hypothetical protein GCM10007421_19680 [Halopseudomonas oceani]
MAQELLVEGAVASPGRYLWRDDLRLLDLTTAVRPTADAWPLGAALLRQSARQEQRKLKAGVLFDLHTARVNAGRIEDPSLTALLERQLQQITRMAVTGRIQAEMNPLKQRLLAYNPLLEPGDHIVYPTRSSTIRLTGAVIEECVTAFVPAQPAAAYLDSCPRHWAADRDYIYLIQPDSTVQRLGVASWNSDDGWLATGGTLYVPFHPALFGESGNDFNDEMAALLATQYTGLEATAADE